MQRGATIFLRAVLVLIGIGGLVTLASILVAATMAVLEHALSCGAELRAQLGPEALTVSRTDSSSGG